MPQAAIRTSSSPSPGLGTSTLDTETAEGPDTEAASDEATLHTQYAL